MTLSEKCERIKKAVSGSDLKNPVKIAENVMREDYVSMHGPEHHFLDGAAFLAAYKNAGGNIDLAACLDELEKRTDLMPGAMCGLWGVCGSAAAVGAALSVIHGTGPLSTDEFYKDLYFAITENRQLFVTPEMAQKIISVIETAHAENPLAIKY